MQYGTGERKPYSKPKMSYAATTEERCSLCDSTRHPLYECEVFRRYPHETKLKTIKQEGLCMNCFVQGHVAKQCRSKPMCTKCSGPHHSILHVERKKSSFTQSKTPAAVTQPAPDKSTCTHTLKDTPSNVLLMTCQLNVMGPKGSMKKARALIDPGSSTSFISERMVKRLRLPRRDSSVKISGHLRSRLGERLDSM